MKDSVQNILIACAKAALPQAPVSLVRHLGNGISDWDTVLALSIKHGISLLLYANLKRVCPELIPVGVMNRLKRIYRNTTAKNLSYESTLLQILKLFEDNGISAVPFKGPLLAEQIYDDIGLRQFDDLDILIKKNDALRARNILIGNGYHSNITLDPTIEKKYLESENFFSFYNHNGWPDIDLHWEMTGRYLLKPVYLDPLEKELKSVDLMGQTVPCLPDALMLVYLCVHGTSHCWSRLEWIVCFTEMLRQNISELPKALTISENMGCKRMLFLGLYLSHDIFNFPIPEELRTEIMRHRGIIRAVGKIKQNILNPKAYSDGNAEWRFSSLHIQIRDTYVDRFKYALYLYTIPTTKELIRWPLFSRLPFFYRLIRPLRLGINFITGKLNL
jgi:hypothetical protein